jgi:hypothetical protein
MSRRNEVLASVSQIAPERWSHQQISRLGSSDVPIRASFAKGNSSTLKSGQLGVEMSVLAYTCPKTADNVITSIDTDPHTLVRLGSLKVSVVCPYCPGGHSIPANEMHFGQVPRGSAREGSLPTGIASAAN